MDTQVQRVLEWREAERQTGYQPLTVWLKADVKHLIEDLASKGGKEMAEVVSEAMRLYAGQQRPDPDYVTAATVRRLVAEYAQDLASGQMRPDPAVTLPTPDRSAEAPAVRLPGEYGFRVQAILEAAPGLGRFTCAFMARQIGAKPKNIQGTLLTMAKRGTLRKKGPVYFWVEPTP